MKTIQIDGIGEVTLRKSARAKRLILKISQSGEAIVTIPKYAPYGMAEKFARQHVDWFIENSSKHAKLVLTEGKRIGRYHRLHFIHKDVTKISSRISKDTVNVTYPMRHTTEDADVQHEARKASVRALKRQAESYLPKLLHAVATRYGYSYREVRIKTVQTRWGSCSTNRIINLSVWLMQVPEELIEYVICHELTHLNHMHHQAEFWAELAVMVPDYKLKRTQLKQYRPELM